MNLLILGATGRTAASWSSRRSPPATPSPQLVRSPEKLTIRNSNLRRGRGQSH